MRRPSADDGVWLCFLLELILTGGWGLLSLALLLLRIWLPIPLVLPILVNLIWLVHAGVGTAILVWANRAGNQPPAPKRKRNPYSASDEEKPGGEDEKD